MSTLEYMAFVKDSWVWNGGCGLSDRDPFEALAAAGASTSVIHAFRFARDAGWDVRLEAVSSHVGGFEYVAAISPKDGRRKGTNRVVRELFDDLDRRRVPDDGPMMRDSRWTQNGNWHWVTDGADL